ncbi:hypothetical protein [Microcella sp.]|uniref:hypothetical protein n=1 Tax=Microcella sp. TaxID=1913979 RepID=UPI003F72C67A
MDWGNSFLQWLASDEGWRVLSGAIIPATAIVIAGAIAALIGRGSTKRLITLHQREALTAAIGGFLLAGRRAAAWNSLGDIERAQLDHLIAEAETRIRLLPIAGAGLAATWSAHELAAMKRDSAGFQFQAQQTLGEYRDRLVAWSEKPRSAKKLFGADLERWQFEVDETPTEPAAGTDAPGQTWVATNESLERSPLTPEPPTAVATATGSMPLIITTPMPASVVRERVLPSSGA